jgi:hypothetical protein
MAAESGWGTFFGGAARVLMVPVATLVGVGVATYSAVADDENFFETCSETFKEVLDDAAGNGEDFGDRHAENLTSTAKFVGKTAATVAVTAAVGGAGKGAKEIWQAKPPGA